MSRDHEDYSKFVSIGFITSDPKLAERIESVLGKEGIPCVVEGSVVYGISVPPGTETRAAQLLTSDAQAQKYKIHLR